MAIERLRANQAGSNSRELRWHQVGETFLDIKTYLFLAMSFGNNLGAQVINTFGPLIVGGLGFDKYTTTLLNMPFGALQYLIILVVAYIAIKFRFKSISLGLIILPIIAGLVVLFVIPRKASNNGSLLAGYYLLSFIFGCNTLIVAWILANTAGETKKSFTMSLYNAAASAGNVVGPLLFKSSDAPEYKPGVKATLGVYIGIFCSVILQLVNLVILNRSQERWRVRNGKPAKIHDHSMEETYEDISAGNDYHIGESAFDDLTDRKNDEFVYVY
ncbi:hypothetical protein N0V82_005361 [Gnomoniopsis sp. IMI 355080]|nr:hypothetical protein N0V82_005361 [Gnomoniopsis sp. IMI 355080]